MAARNDVAQAWKASQPAKGSNYATDGQTIKSYGWHITAVTVPAETGITWLPASGPALKVAFDCHYSVTTTKQTGPAKVAADVVIPCQTCKLNAEHRRLSGPGLEEVLEATLAALAAQQASQ